jgi:hypothetical protein
MRVSTSVDSRNHIDVPWLLPGPRGLAVLRQESIALTGVWMGANG